MPVRTWHVGKLALVWIMSVLGALVCLALSGALSDRAQSERQRRAAWDADEQVLRRLGDSARISRDSLRRVLGFALARIDERIAHLPTPPAGVPRLPSLAPDSLRDSRRVVEHDAASVRQLFAHPPARPSVADVYLQWLAVAAAVLMVAAPFAVSWRWFGGREVRSKEPPS